MANTDIVLLNSLSHVLVWTQVQPGEKKTLANLSGGVGVEEMPLSFINICIGAVK